MIPKKSILLMDSCGGGFGVLKYFLDWAGNYDLNYLADGKNNPFGEKTSEEIKEFVFEAIKKFKELLPNLELVVIACNTASIAINEEVQDIKKRFNVSIVTMIDGAKSSINKEKEIITGGNNLIIGTKLTIKSQTYENLISKAFPSKIYTLIGEKTEKFVAQNLEKNNLAREEMILELEKYRLEKIDSIFLGCTCYEFVKPELEKIYGSSLKFLNPAKEVSDISRNILNSESKEINIDKVRVYTTGELKVWKKNLSLTSKKMFNKDLHIKKINIK